MDGYYMVGVTTIPYPRYRSIITIVSKEDKTYLVSIAHNPQCTCLDFAKMSSMVVGKRGQWVSYKHCIMF